MTSTSVLTAVFLVATMLIAGPAFADYRAATEAFEKARKLQDGPDRERSFLAAARLLQEAVARAPDAPDAAEATLLAVHAFKDAREIGEAIFMLEVFTRDQGSEARLAQLQNGDAKATPPSPPNPLEYRHRVKQLTGALEDLVKAHLALFDYAEALRVFDVTSANARLDAETRRRAVHGAVALHAAFGDRKAAKAARDLGERLGEGAATLAWFDSLLVELDLRAWRLAIEGGADPKPAAAAAIRSATAYADRYKAKPDAARLVAESTVKAATIAARAKLPDHAPLCKKAHDAVDRLIAGQHGQSVPAWLDEDLRAACDPPRTAGARAPLGRYLRSGAEASLPPPFVAGTE